MSGPSTILRTGPLPSSVHLPSTLPNTMQPVALTQRSDLEANLEVFAQRRPGVAIAAAIITPDHIETSYRNCGPQSEFQIASISKVITAVLLSKAVAEGRCELDDPLSRWLPPGTRIPKYFGKAITLRHLATQTSGLPRLPLKLALRDARSKQPYNRWDRRELLRALSLTILERRPGSTYSYSNFGFAILGLALESIYGTTYEQLVSSLGAELGCPGLTIKPDPGKMVQGRNAVGVPVEAWDLNAFAPAGGCWSTLESLATFAQRNISTPRPDYLTAAMSEIRTFSTHAPPGSALPRSVILGLTAATIEWFAPTAFFFPLICVEIAAFGGLTGGVTAAAGWEIATALCGGSANLIGERFLYSLFAIGLGAVAPSTRRTQEMALGWHVGQERDRNFVWHNGMTSSFSSYMRVDPYDQKAVVILAGRAGSPNLYSEVMRGT